MARYYVGVDWGDAVHAVWVCDESGGKVAELQVDQTPEGMSVFGHWLHERTAEGIDLWAGIEKPEGRIVDFLLDHGVVVYSTCLQQAGQSEEFRSCAGSVSDKSLQERYV